VESGRAAELNLSPGAHELLVRAPRHAPFRKLVNVAAGKVVVLPIALRREAAAPQPTHAPNNNDYMLDPFGNNR
jgi:hypothetical protein